MWQRAYGTALMSAEPRRLGRGLEALIPGSTASTPAAVSDLQRIALSRVRQNPYQPRRRLIPRIAARASLKTDGLLQPITVRRQGDAFELIAMSDAFAATNLAGPKSRRLCATTMTGRCSSWPSSRICNDRT
jgi:ParB family chromosome partitioning protein